MKRTSPLCGLVLLAFASVWGVHAHAAKSAAPAYKTVKISVDWNCPQTAMPNRPPVEPTGGKVDFYLEEVPNSAGAMRLSKGNFRSLLKFLDKDRPDVDYFDCARKVLIDLDSRLAGKNIDGVDVIDSLRDEVVAYGRRAFDRGARAPVIPLSPAARPLSKEEVVRDLCQVPWSSSQSPYYASEEFIKNVLPTFELGPECSRRLDREYARIFSEARLTDKQCAANRANCNMMKAASARAMALVSSTIKAPITKDLNALISQCDPSRNGLLSHLGDLMDQSRLANACEPLAPGDSRDANNPTNLGKNFKLRRDNDKDGKPVYVASVPIRFLEGKDKKSLGLEQKMRSHAQECFKNAEPFLTGPNDEKLKVEIQSQLEYKDSNVVNVWPKIERADSADWSEEIECPTVLHEVFHLLGLVDAYQESDGNFAKTTRPMATYDCRPLGPEDSVMRSQRSALAAVSPNVEVNVCTCDDPVVQKDAAFASQCLVDLQYTQEERKQQSGADCPITSTRYKQTGLTMYGINDSGSGDARIYNELLAGYGHKSDMTLSITRVSPTTKRKSLLYPAEFRMITQAGCAPANRSYFACSRNSYRTSRDHFGEGCLPLPAECSKGSMDWLLR